MKRILITGGAGFIGSNFISNTGLSFINLVKTIVCKSFIAVINSLILRLGASTVENKIYRRIGSRKMRSNPQLKRTCLRHAA